MNWTGARALVFDVDGTMYRQSPVRAGMAGRLLLHTLRGPVTGMRTWRLLREYRRQQERLRDLGPAGRQLELACARAGVEPEWGAACIETWIHERPLDLVADAIYPGLLPLLKEAAQRGLALAVASDYPAERKLRSLGVWGFFSSVVCATDPQVGQLKPAPISILTALRNLRVEPAEALYIGDRPEVDGEAARRAGVTCAIINLPLGRRGDGWSGVPDYSTLGHLLGMN